MAWSVLQSASNTNAGSGNVSVTFSAANLSSGTKVIALVSASASAGISVLTSVKDGAGNTWTQLAFKMDAGLSVQLGLYALDTPAGDVGTKPTITATIGTNFGASILVQEVSGLLAGNTTAMLDGTAATATGTASPATTGAYSSAAASEFLFLGYADPGFAVTLTTPSGWSADAHNVTGSSLADCAIYSRNSTGGAESASVTLSGAANWNTVLAAFQLAAAGGGSAAADVPARQVVPPGLRHPASFSPRGLRGRRLPDATPPPAPPVGASLAGAGSVTALATVSAPASLAGAGSLSASTGQYISGLGGTGAGYFVDNTGKPRLVWGDAAWALPGNAGRWNSGNWQADFDTYLATRAAQGFTVVYAKPIGTTQSGNLDNFGKTFDALYPFQGGTPSTGVSGANPSSGLTSAFWARIDYFLNSALAKGITVFFNAIGYSSDFDSGPGPLAGKSTTEFTAYGTALGTRYASQPNLVWHLADDYFSDLDSVITAFMTGVTGAGDTHAVSIENLPESTSRFTLDASPTTLPWGDSNAGYNFVYSYNQEYYGIERAYAESSPITVIQGDGYFYQGGTTYSATFDRAFRQAAWWSLASGARGKVHGSESIWQWASSALAASSTDWWYVNNSAAIVSAFTSLTGWHLLVPDTASALVTGGRGTRASAFTSGGSGGQYEPAFTSAYVAASRTPDSGSGSSLAVLYLPKATTITIDQTKMGAGYTATWVDPVTGATSSATTGSTYNSTAKGNNSQGDPDWVLVLQAPASSSGTATLTGAGSLAALATVAAPEALTGAGTVTAKVTESVTAALTGAGTVSAPVVQIATATLTGAGTLTASSGGSASGTATLTGTGSLAATAVQAAVASPAGAGSLTGSVTQQAGTSLAGAGSVAAAVTESVTATVTGAGSLSAVSGGFTSGTATLTGAGSVTAAGSVSAVGTATLTGAGTVSAAARQAAGAQLAGAGTLAAPAALRAPAALTAAGSVTAAATAHPPNVPATSAATVAAAVTSASTATDPRDGTASVTSTVTSSAGVT